MIELVKPRTCKHCKKIKMETDFYRSGTGKARFCIACAKRKKQIYARKLLRKAEERSRLLRDYPELVAVETEKERQRLIRAIKRQAQEAVKKADIYY